MEIQDQKIHLSFKEKFRLIVLIFLIPISISLLLLLKDMSLTSTKKETKVRIDWDSIASRNATKLLPEPFKEDGKIMDTITDDEYLKTEPFYYLIHKMVVSNEEDINKAVDPSFDWPDLKKLDNRHNIRGKIMRIRGGIVGITREVLTGESAKQRGLEGMEYWQGLIFTGNGLPHLFVTTDPPERIGPDDDAEFIGAFYKIWVYENRQGGKTKAPFFIGKKLRKLVVVKGKGPEHLKWVLSAILFLVMIVLVVALLKERKDAKDFSKKIHTRKKNIPKNSSNQV